MKEIILNIFSLILLSICPQIVLAIIPEKNIYYPTIPRNKELYKQLSEADLNEVADRIIKVYYEFTNIHYKAKIVFNKDWSNDQVSAFATQPNDNEFHITVAGGIVRAPGMTKDALALVLCHELGHHLGGAPRTALYNGWPSAEGQADYFATAKCLKKYFYEIRNEEIDISSNIPEKVMSDCNSIYTNFIDMKICTRSILASLDFANFLNQLPTTKIPVKLETPDTRIVKGTNINNYPRPQCRFDTLYAGALCSLSADLRSSIDDPGTGYCMDETRPGTRPHCWYYK